MRQSHTDANRDTNCYSYTYSYANGNTDGYSYTHNYPTANAHAEDCSVAEGASDSAAETVGADLPVISEK